MAVAVGSTRMNSDNGTNLYSFFQPKSNIVNSITIEEDANGSRRKRQRTASPSQKTSPSTDVVPNSCENQVQAVAYGKRTVSMGTSEPATSSAINAEKHNVKEEEGSAADRGPTSGHASDKKTLSTPPKKMLKVRSDGKLISPKSRETSNKPLRGGRKKPTKPGIRKKELLVTLKYGKDEESRKIIAQKILDICTAAAYKQSNRIGTTQHAPAPVEPSKPTHPFFLGPLARIPDQKPPATETQAIYEEGAGQGQGQQKAKHSPKKIIAVSKASIGARAWSSIGGFGAEPFGSESSRAFRFPEIIAPILPPQGMVHVGREVQPNSHITNNPQISEFLRMPPKMKDAAVHISEREDFLRPYADLVKSCRKEKNRATTSYERRGIRYPARRIMTGPELQLTVRQNISCTLPISEKLRNLGCKDESKHISFRSGQAQAHNAVLQVYESIEDSLTAFDKFECESQDWVHKYAPKSAEQVLQQGPEAMLLRNWLKRLTVTSVKSRSADASTSSNPIRKIGLNSRGKRQKKSVNLEGFVISSDEELDHMDELADPRLDDPNLHAPSLTKRSVLRSGDMLDPSDKTGSSGRATNVVVISGPHGCGKTATVYAVAKELNFEVFEITAGSRRSGKDLLDKVGDMTRNHLVTRPHELNGSNGDEGDISSEDVSLISDALIQDLKSGRQGTMHSFFRPNVESEKRPKRKAHSNNASQQLNGKPKYSSGQKQSVILLEEVDVLFEEDKQFWATTLDLILQSKRPIIMTCTDESPLPLDDLPLHAILRFTSPPELLVIDYLLLIACNEGHLISRQAVSALYRCKGYDLRASITELNFFCQMALGDTKAGLGWMLVRSFPQECQNEKGEALRVVSEGTYLEGMGWVSGEDRELGSENWVDAQGYVLEEVINEWSMDMADCETLVPRMFLASQGQVNREGMMTALEDLDHASDALSVADTYSCYDGRQNNSTILDPTQPQLTEKSRVNYVDGLTLLQADPLVEPTGLATSFALALMVCTGGLFARTNDDHSVAPLRKESYFELIRGNAQKSRRRNPVTRSSLSAAFSTIASSPKALSGGPYVTSFDNTTSVIVEEVAPYVRSIVSYDMRLEEQRLRLNSLLSEGARNGKRIRTTRASRAALEGGSKADTRRERWFPGSLNFSMVLRTGGSNWQSLAVDRASFQGSEEDISPDTSRQASVGSTMAVEV